MRVRKLSPTGDYTWGQNLLNFYIDEPAGVAQVIRTSLLLWQGEWYLDISVGTPWMTNALGNHTQAQADQMIQNVTLNVQGIDKGNSVALVTKVSNYVSSLDSSRHYSAVFDVDTIYGPSPVDIQNFMNF